MYADFWKCFNLPPDLEDSAHANFIAWERLRLYFNGALVAVVVVSALLVVLVTGAWKMPIEPFLERVEALVTQTFISLVIVNIGFSQGPIIEGYLVTLGGKSRTDTRMFLFLFTLICCGLVAFCIAMSVMGGVDLD